MSYEGLLSATYGQTPDLVKLCNTTPPRCPSDDMQQLSHSNSYNFEALITSPWVKQYRSMCTEFGRNFFPSDCDATVCTFPLSGDVGPGSHKSANDDVHPNSVGQRVFSFLRGAFRRTSDDIAQELATSQSDKHRINRKQNKKLECLVSHKSWRTSTPWIGRRKENQTNNEISKTVIANKQLFAIRHSGSRSAEHFKKRTHSPPSRVRDTSSAPLEQTNSQNSTPTSRPSALVTTRSSSDKSREGAAKRTRFSLHPSTCNAPPELIRRRRDGDESVTPLSATAESFAKSDRCTKKLFETSECVAKKFDSEASLVPKHVGDVGSCASKAEYNPTNGKSQTALHGSVVSNLKEHGKSAVELSHQKTPVSTYTNNQELVNSVNSRNVVNEKTESSAPQTKVTSSPKRSNVSSQPVSTPVVTVAPVIKVVPRRMNSSSSTSERKRVTFETPTYHSVPSTPVSSLDLDSPPVQRKNSFDSTIRRFCGENSEQFQEHAFSENSVRRNVQENGENTGNPSRPYLDSCSETAVVTKTLDVKSADATKRRVCRFRRYRRLIADLNQIYRNYAAPYDLTRELVDEICQIEIIHIVRSLLTEELKNGSTPELDNKTSATNKILNTPIEQANEKVSEVPGKQELSLRKCDDMAMGIVKNRKFTDLDEWFGLKPVSNGGKETHLGRILSSTCSIPHGRRGTLEPMDAFPTKDLNDPIPQDFHSRQTHTSIQREVDSTQTSVNTCVKKFRNIPNSDASQRLQGELEKWNELYSVHQIAFEPEEAPKLELRSQQLTETMEDHFSSEMEFSDEYNIACSSLSSKEVRLNHLVHSSAGDLKNRSAKAEQPVTLTCHCAQTCRPTGLTLGEPQFQCGKPRYAVPEPVYNKARSSSTRTSTSDQKAKKGLDSVEHNLTVTPIHVEDSSEQKRTTESDELSTTHLWNQIHQSLVELTSLSDEGLWMTPERATATVRLERSSSSVARSDTVDSLSPCLSRMGPSFNPDVTGFSEPSISTISIPDDNSSIPWSRARIVVLRDSVNQCSNTTPTTIIVRRQVSHVSCQTESSFIQNESELRKKHSSTRSNDSVNSCPCHQTGLCNACGTMSVEGNGHPTSRGEMRPESSQNTCPLCSAHNSGISLGSPVISNHAEVAVQTETSQNMAALKVGSNAKITTSGTLADKVWASNVEHCYRTRFPGTKEVAKSILSDSMPQVRDVGDCVRKRSSLWDPTLVLRPKSKSSAASSGSLGLISRSHLDIHSNSGRYRESTFSPIPHIPRKTTNSDHHGRMGRSQKTGSKTVSSTWFRRPQPDTDASSGDSQLGNSTILYRKSHSNYLGRCGRVDQKIPHAKQLLRDPESELSDGEASSSVSSTRQGYPCRRRAERRKKPLKSLSQPPAFEMVRLDERRSRVRLNTRKPNYTETKPRERKTPHELLLELREMKKQYSAPHVARSLYTRHSSASSSSQRGSNKPVPFCTQPGSVHLSKKRSSATKQDVDFSRTESEPGVLRTSGLRRPNRQKTLSVRSYPSTSPHSAHRTRSISNSAPQLQSSCNVTTGKRITKPLNTRAELSRPQTHATGPSYPQISNRSLREPLIRRTHPSFGRTNRSWYKPDTILSHVTEIRPVDDSLLRHTFASLQKVRNKVRPVVSPTINGRPPMIFKR